MKLKKLLATLLVVTMVLSTMGIAVFAEEDVTVAKIGDTPYKTLEEAVAAAEDGDTIVLLSDVELSGTISTNKNITLDGNTHKITPAANFAADGHNAVLVFAAGNTEYNSNINCAVKNVTFEGFSGLSRVVRANFAKITIDNCDFNNNTVSEGVITSAYADLTVNACEFNGNTSEFAVINVGSDVSNGTELVANLTGNTFAGNSAAIAVIFAASSANVTDSSFSGNIHTGSNENAAAILAGPYTGSMEYTININKNAFVNAMSKEGSALPAVFAEDWSSYGSTTAFDLNSNYWNGIEPAENVAYKTSGSSPNVTLNDYYTTYANNTLGGIVTLASYVAQIGNIKYASLDAALSAANDGDTIVLLADCTIDTNIDIVNKTLVIDGDYTVTNNAVVKITDSSLTMKKLVNNREDEFMVYGESTLNIENFTGKTIAFMEGAIIKNSTIGGAQAVYVAGNIIFRGDNTFYMISDFGDYYSKETPSKWTVEKGGSLTLTHTDRYGLGYGDVAVVYGELAEGEAKTARESLTETDTDLTFDGGLVGMTNSAAKNAQNSFTAKNAYLRFGHKGDKSFGNKSGSYYGNYTFSFENVVMDANAFKFYEDLGTSNVTFKDSDVLANGIFMTNDASSSFTFENTKVVSNAASNGTDDKNQNAGIMTLKASDVTYNAKFTNIGTVHMDGESFIKAPEIESTGTITIDASNLVAGAEITVIEQTVSDALSLEGKVVLLNGKDVKVNFDGGDVKLKKFVWTTATDAGFYKVGETPVGMMRFLFNVDYKDAFVKTGVKYFKSDLTEVTHDEVSGTETSFFGDVTGIPEETDLNKTYYAMGYIQIGEGNNAKFYWSDAVPCSPNFEKEFTNYAPVAKEATE